MDILHLALASDVEIAEALAACYTGGPENADIACAIERVNDICSLFWIWE